MALESRTLHCIHRDPAQLILLQENGYALVTAANGHDGLRLEPPARFRAAHTKAVISRPSSERSPYLVLTTLTNSGSPCGKQTLPYLRSFQRCGS